MYSYTHMCLVMQTYNVVLIVYISCVNCSFPFPTVSVHAHNI